MLTCCLLAVFAWRQATVGKRLCQNASIVLRPVLQRVDVTGVDGRNAGEGRAESWDSLSAFSLSIGAPTDVGAHPYGEQSDF